MALISNTEEQYYNSGEFGGYQYVSMDEAINNFTMAYIGEGRLLQNVPRHIVRFHFMRSMQELSYDLFVSKKSMEWTLQDSLTFPLPIDYVNWSRISWVDSAGVERPIVPTSKTSNPRAIQQEADGSLDFDGNGDLNEKASSETWDRFKTSTNGISESTTDNQLTDNFDSLDDAAYGGVIGADPRFSHSNGVFYIDLVQGNIHFSSDLSGRTILLRYVSDSLASDSDAFIPKMAEEAVYQSVLYSMVSNTSGIPEYVVRRIKKQRRAAFLNSKIRLGKFSVDRLKQTIRMANKRIKN